MDEDRRTLFERLSGEGRRLAPVNYRFSRTSPISGALFTRLAESRPYRAGGYVCWPFRKPISKCCGPDDENDESGEKDMAGMAPEPGGPREPVFNLFACCLPVKGARRSVICDLQRQDLHFIPNGLYEILTEHAGETLAQIKDFYAHEFDQEIDEYFDFLLRHELGFWCSDPSRFPPLGLQWETPERITNAIVDVDERSVHDYAKILGELDDLGCKALEIRCFHSCRLDELSTVFQAARYGRLRSIDLLAGWGSELTPEALEALVREHHRVSSVVIHSAPERRRLVPPRTGVTIEYRTEVIDSPRCCGKIHPGYFVVDLETFVEGQGHNTCLNRKISVDARGEIRNCPSLARSFGNVREVSLHSALAQRDFTALWSINKDRIDVCKDCEFRYVCTDCRAYLGDADLYAKPSKCTYDPYTAEWQPPVEASAGIPDKGVIR